VRQAENLQVRGDYNGNGNADFVFLVRNEDRLIASDFIF